MFAPIMNLHMHLYNFFKAVNLNSRPKHLYFLQQTASSLLASSVCEWL